MGDLQLERNLADPDLVRREQGPPYSLFAAWRKADPVHWNPPPSSYNNPNPDFKIRKGFWVFTKYQDVFEASRNPLLFSSALGGPTIWDLEPERLAEHRAGIMGMDPPQHAAVKRLVVPPFAPRNLQAFTPEIAHVAKKIVDAVADKGACEFVFDVASRLPVYTFCVLMGIPEADRERIFTIGNACADMENQQDVRALHRELAVYSQKLAADKRANPDASMMSAYVNGEVDGDKLSPGQIAMFFSTVAVAGHETTRNTAVHFIRLMNDYPEQYALLRSDLDAYLPGAIDEVLRFAPPVMNFRRTATQDMVVSGASIKQGDKIYLAYGAANRDPEVFPDPDKFDIMRANAGKHLSFGTGEHVCLGARLALTQLACLLREIITRIPDIHPTEEPVYINNIAFNGLRQMHVAYTPERMA